MALGVGFMYRTAFLNRLLEKGVNLLPGIRYDEVIPGGLVFTTKEGNRKTIEADTIVLATGSTPDKELYDEIKSKGFKVCLAGDCVEPRTIREAIADGYRTGLEII